MKARRSLQLPKPDRSLLIAGALLLVAAAITYLPNLLQATVYRDDWYYLLDRMIGGPGIFQAMFNIDRPARGPFFELYYQFFGINPIPYHLTSFAWRFLGGLAALWLFRLIWPAHPRATMWMALLFVLFPGYLRWMEGFEDQPSVASVCLEALSIALTLKAIGSTTSLARVSAWIGSILAGWVYLALVDYGMGMEVFRFLCVFIFVNRGDVDRGIWKQGLAAVRAWAAALLIPLGFLVWRLFIFHGERPQTDIARQLGVFFSSPLSTSLSWLARTVQSAVNVAVFSWITPVLQQFFDLQLRSLLIGGVLACLALIGLYLADRILRREAETASPDDGSEAHLGGRAVWLGGIGVLGGVLPVTLANRYVDFQSFSHYALPVSLAGAVFVGGLIYSVQSRGVRLHIVGFLVACAVLAHFAYSLQVLDEERTVSTFWHQLAWRVPGLRPQTTIFVNYPGINYSDNADAADGPANFVYFSQPTGRIPVTYPIMALPQAQKTTEDVLVGKDQQTGYRTHVGSLQFDQLLVLSQPSDVSCVHVIDARWPLFSAADTDQIRVIGPYSRAENVLAGHPDPQLNEAVFGPEPSHRWCYYFEKADLALQLEDWTGIEEIGKQVAQAGLHPEDWVEWTPFLQAYASLGDEALFAGTAHRMNGDPFARVQACRILTDMQKSGHSFSAGIQVQIGSLLCRGQ